VALVPHKVAGAPRSILLREKVTRDGITVVPDGAGYSRVVTYIKTPSGVYEPSVSAMVQMIIDWGHLAPSGINVSLATFACSFLNAKAIYVIYPIAALGKLSRALGPHYRFLDYDGGPLSDPEGKATCYIGVPTSVGAAYALWKMGLFVLNGEIQPSYFSHRGVNNERMDLIRDLISSGVSAASVTVGTKTFYDIVEGRVPVPKVVGTPEGVSYPALVIVGGKGSGKTPVVCALRLAGVECFDSDDYIAATDLVPLRKEFLGIVAVNNRPDGFSPEVLDALRVWYQKYCGFVREAVAKAYALGKRQCFVFHTLAEMQSCQTLMNYRVLVIDIAPNLAITNVKRRSRDLEYELPFATFLWSQTALPGGAKRVLPVAAIGAALVMAQSPDLEPAAASGGGEGALPRAV
jgi:hypothetical protein